LDRKICKDVIVTELFRQKLIEKKFVVALMFPCKGKTRKVQRTLYRPICVWLVVTRIEMVPGNANFSFEVTLGIM
jgi:hypothetical protein